MRPDPDERDYPERLRRVDVDSALRPLMLASAAEIERLQAAKRAALAIADERSRENVALRALLKEIATLKRDSDGFDAEATLINIQAMAARTLGLEQKAGES